MTKDWNILILLDHLNDEKKRLLEEVAPQSCFVYSKRNDADREAVQNAQIIIGNPPGEKVAGSPNLQFLQLTSAGSESYVGEGVLRDNVILCNGTGTYGIPISEYMVGAVFSLFKNFPLYRDQQKQGNWKVIRAIINKPVFGSTAMAVGAGDIGGSFLLRMKALGCTTIGVRRTMGQKPDYMDEQFAIGQLDGVLPRADIVALALPKTPLTIGLFNARRLSLMKEDSILINVGRGTAVDTEALCDELEKGRIRGAALDVTDPEPLPEGHRLWKYENVMITPHTSATNSPLTWQKSFELCYENFKAFVEGKPLRSVVDRKTGYKVSGK